MPLPPQQRRILLAGLALCALAVTLVLAGYAYREALPDPEQVRGGIQSLLQTVPVPVYFAAFCVLPAAGFPLTLFYLTAIPVMGGAHPFIGIGLAWLAVAINMALTKLLARGVLLPLIEWVIRHRHLAVPRIRAENEWKVVLATRLSPVPFALQNYVLALGHARWRYYLGLSILIQGSIGLAVMLVGESILTGGLGYVLLALFVFLLLHLLFDHLRNRLTKDRAPSN